MEVTLFLKDRRIRYAFGGWDSRGAVNARRDVGTSLNKRRGASRF
jgi:hypothetical protein